MSLEEIIDKLRSEKSVKAVFLLEGDFYDDVIDEESSVTESTSGMHFVNRALEEVRKRGTAVCLFCEGALETMPGHVIVMEDSCGNTVGHDVPPSMICDFKEEPGMCWLSEDFVVYPDKAMDDVMIVMLPRKVLFIGEKEGAGDPVLLYPATTTDIMLRRHFGIPLNSPHLASAILGFKVL